ncbi:amidase signature enzyme [Penicillium lividum]|nr:amidase signature enzyme [Penicillium lividum]
MSQLKECADSGETIFTVDGFRYMIPSSDNAISLTGPQQISLVTVFAISGPAKAIITEEWVRKTVENCKNTDDVFHEAFLVGVIFYGIREDEAEITDQARMYLSKLGNKWINYMTSADTGRELLPGPYVLLKNQLRDVWRLVDDVNRTCMVTLRPQPGVSKPLQLYGSDSQSLSIALPSRLRSQHNSTDSSIAGWRVVIKDNIHMQGIKTSLGNRAFHDTYPPQSQTADCIQRLMDRGVVILGKAKMTSFATWEEPVEYVDYQAPWNDRADRYQSPGGSSSGSAAAVSAYDWLDIAIGTDTWGSVTRPALWCGCFGLRPSIGSVSIREVEPCVESWDIPGFLGRDLAKCREFAAAWLQEEALVKEPKVSISAIIWPTDFWSIIDPDQCDLALKLVKDMESHLGLQHCKVSFDDIWKSEPPYEAGGLSLIDFIGPATAALAYDGYHNCDDFFDRYRKAFHHAPHISLPNRKLWGVGQRMSKMERDDGFNKIEIYARWFKERVLTGDRANAFVVLPLENMSPRYRDEVPNFKRPPQDGINALALAPVLKAPVLAVPISEIPYESRITEITENLPFAVAIMSPPGTDLMLMETIYDVLKSTGRPTVVKTGKKMF